MFLLYDLIFVLYALVYLPYLLLTKRGYPGFGMRFGIFSEPIKEQIRAKANIWVHAVSVGEVMVLDGFIDQLRKKYPSYQLIATVTTKTGYALACERLKNKALVIPSPIDFSFIAKAFVTLINPKIYIAVETEIWPNLYRQLSSRGIPIAVINGRISDNSFGRYKAIRFLLKEILNQVSVWCMQSHRDAERIKELGAKPLHVVVTGNVKFDDAAKASDKIIDNLLGSKDELWWIAGSTHSGEEEIVLDVYTKIVKENPQWRLIIAPRHIERVGEVMGLISQRGLEAVKYSQILTSPSAARKDIVIVDTIGQLRSLYSFASMVFVGKSLCVGGGHNIIEPAFFGKAIVIGPKFENFKDIVTCFKEGDAVVVVEDAEAFEKSIMSLSIDASKREALGHAALKVIAANQGATQRSLDFLEGLIS